jgi:hypothetical protein
VPLVSRVCFWLGLVSLVLGVALSLFTAFSSASRREDTAVVVTTALLVLIVPAIGGALLLGLSRLLARR